MDSRNFYSEEVFDQAHDNGTEQDYWMSVMYEDRPLAFIRLDEEEYDVLRNGSSIEPYHNFLIKLDSNREEFSHELRGLDSYNIIDHTVDSNPGVIYKFAGEGFARDIDKEIMNRFDKKDKDGVEEDFDLIFEGMDTIVQSVLEGRADDFRRTMDRQKLIDNSLVIYESSLKELYTSVNQVQREQRVD